MSDGGERTYGSAEVCRVVGVARPTFDAWLLRGYLPLRNGPGTGRQREFSLLDAVRIAAVAQLTYLGVTVRNASAVGLMLSEVPEIIDTPAGPGRLALVILRNPDTEHANSHDRGFSMMLTRFTCLADVEKAIRDRYHQGSLSGFIMLDITTIAARTRSGLENPSTRPPRET
jgi:hypothetical protein